MAKSNDRSVSAIAAGAIQIGLQRLNLLALVFDLRLPDFVGCARNGAGELHPHHWVDVIGLCKRPGHPGINIRTILHSLFG